MLQTNSNLVVLN